MKRLFEDFWRWFKQEEPSLRQMVETGDCDRLQRAITVRLQAISRGLRWELGPGKLEEFSFTVCSGGDASLRETARQLIAAAPVMVGWEFYSSRQPKGVPPVIELPGLGVLLRPDDWLVRVSSANSRGQHDIVVFSDELAKLGERDALTAIFIWLDSALGEETVEERIGNVEVAGRAAAQSAQAMTYLMKVLRG